MFEVSSTKQTPKSLKTKHQGC